MKQLKKNLVSCIIAFTFILILTSTLDAATLIVGSASGSPGDKGILIPVDLSAEPGEAVSSFSLKLNFDISRLSFKEVTLGPKAAEAGKSLSSNPETNKVSIRVIGANQNIIENGTVLNFTFDILPKAPIGKAEITIIRPSITDMGAKSLPANAVDGSITVNGELPETTTSSISITPTTTPTTVETTTTTTTPRPSPDSTTTTSASNMSTSSTTSSSTTTSISQLWPLLYDKMWGSKKDLNLLFLRTFRDEILVNTEVGREYISMLYNNSLEILTLLLQDPSLTVQTKEVVNEFLISVKSLFYNDTMEIRRDTIIKFKSLLDHAETKASPELKTAIKKLKRDIGEEKRFTQLGITIVK